MNDLRVNGRRLQEYLVGLSRHGRTAQGGVSRVAYSQADIEGREYTIALMWQAGLQVRVDPVGNIFGCREGSESGAPAILFGSHIDSVPNGGAYDGALGSMAAIEVVQALAEAGYCNRHPLEVAIWADEEGGLIGSRGYVGALSDSDLSASGEDGISLADKIRRIDGHPERIGDAKPADGSITAYVELHVEQGSTLESEGIDIGIVQGFVGINHYDVTITGRADHAGTTPMNARSDALLAAAATVLAVDETVKSIPGEQVGTVGRLCVRPGVPNVVPGEVELTVELRDLEMALIESVWRRIQLKLEEIATGHGIEVAHTLRQSLPGALTDPRIRRAIAKAAEVCCLSSRSMSSGAGHDAQNLARICPAGMIFVPSVGGVSHSPEEHTRPADAENGANVLLQTILQLDQW
ncbi:MAG: hydantoinase/carbamoylase family amidase [Gemmatimonadales bacterium]|nr:hydantoinase/carbamoylase family amidase [Gemmatimonadales bacterium]NIN10248.1 hydantoinase/carbamoylase family amidase [Gemmatimonadales bacterium]NIN49044.1 hydantoinase/carbamoylase family amidase [Gemmatimonadales bacterium]NIP06508.1 hydantoinase/carbamoylase family amidase [Gemmatimonadales bacterium]NIQ98851.1 hydantoinase/carbamoylase family amidase [Gemmatimonadales bacterium]